MVAIDDADAENGGLEVVSGCFDRVLPMDERGCVDRSVEDTLVWQPVTVPAGATLWFHSRTPHRSGPNRSGRACRALYPTYNAAREGDRRGRVLRGQGGGVRVGDARRPRAGLADRRLRGTARMKVVFTVLDALPARHVGTQHTPVLTALAQEVGVAPGRARAVMTAATYPNHATFATGDGPASTGSPPTTCRAPVASPRRGSSDPRCRRCSTCAGLPVAPARPSWATSA